MHLTCNYGSFSTASAYSRTSVTIDEKAVKISNFVDQETSQQVEIETTNSLRVDENEQISPFPAVGKHIESISVSQIPVGKLTKLEEQSNNININEFSKTQYSPDTVIMKDSTLFESEITNGKESETIHDKNVELPYSPLVSQVADDATDSILNRGASQTLNEPAMDKSTSTAQESPSSNETTSSVKTDRPTETSAVDNFHASDTTLSSLSSQDSFLVDRAASESNTADIPKAVQFTNLDDISVPARPTLDKGIDNDNNIVNAARVEVGVVVANDTLMTSEILPEKPQATVGQQVDGDDPVDGGSHSYVPNAPQGDVVKEMAAKDGQTDQLKTVNRTIMEVDEVLGDGSNVTEVPVDEDLTVLQDAMPSFDEWKQKEQEKHKNLEATKQYQVLSMPPQTKVKGSSKKSINYASVTCGAKIVAHNPEAQNPAYVLIENKDQYMINPCKAKKLFTVELCEPVQVQAVEMGNLELFSSLPQTFEVHISDRYPTKDWKTLGTFHAREERSVQSFPVDEPMFFAKYIKIEIISHYGSEHYCPLSIIRVHGLTVDEDDDEREVGNQDNTDDETTATAEATIDNPTNLFTSATDTVLSLVKNVLNPTPDYKADVDGKSGGLSENSEPAVDAEFMATIGLATEEMVEKKIEPCAPDAKIPSSGNEEIHGVSEAPVLPSYPNATIQNPDVKTDDTVTQTDSLYVKSKPVDTVVEQEPVPSKMENTVSSFSSLSSSPSTVNSHQLSDILRDCRTCRSSNEQDCRITNCEYLRQYPLMGNGDCPKCINYSNDCGSTCTYYGVAAHCGDFTPTNVISTKVMHDSRGTFVSVIDCSVDVSQANSASKIAAVQSNYENGVGTESLSHPSSSEAPSTESVLESYVEEIDAPSSLNEKASTEGSDAVQHSQTASKPGETKNTAQTVKVEGSGFIMTDPNRPPVVLTGIGADSKPAIDDVAIMSTTKLPEGNNLPLAEVNNLPLQHEDSQSAGGTADSAEKPNDQPKSVSPTAHSSTDTPSTTGPVIGTGSTTSTAGNPGPQTSINGRKDIYAMETVAPKRQDGGNIGGGSTVNVVNTVSDYDSMDEVTYQKLSSRVKESIFVKLKNRIRALEINLNLSNRYLEELSQRYKRQMDDMYTSLNRTITKLSNTAKSAEDRDLRQQERIATLELDVVNMTAAMRSIQNVLESFQQQMIERHMLLMTLEFVAFLVAVTFLSYRWPRPVLHHPPTQDTGLAVLDSRSRSKEKTPVAWMQPSVPVGTEVKWNPKCRRKSADPPPSSTPSKLLLSAWQQHDKSFIRSGSESDLSAIEQNIPFLLSDIQRIGHDPPPEMQKKKKKKKTGGGHQRSSSSSKPFNKMIEEQDEPHDPYLVQPAHHAVTCTNNNHLTASSFASAAGHSIAGLIFSDGRSNVNSDACTLKIANGGTKVQRRRRSDESKFVNCAVGDKYPSKGSDSKFRPQINGSAFNGSTRKEAVRLKTTSSKSSFQTVQDCSKWKYDLEPNERHWLSTSSQNVEEISWRSDDKGANDR